MLDEHTGFCAPDRIDHYKKTGSCLKTNEARQLINVHNKKSPSRQLPTNIDFKNMLIELKRNLPDTCKQEHCLLKKPEFAKHVKSSFRPAKPSEWEQNAREWLNTDDIIAVLKQYESSHTHFEFVGVFPINFAEKHGDACISRRICDVPMFMERIVYSGKTQFGIVFNLDRHDQSGSHWVTMYCNLDPAMRFYGVYYYDAVAVPPKKEFRDLMNEIQKYVHTHIRPQSERHFCKQYNKHRRQYKNTECGVFCMVFIINCIQYGSHTHFRKVCMNMKDDDHIHQHRHVLYTP